MNEFQKLTDMTELCDVVSEMTKKYLKTFLRIRNKETDEKLIVSYREFFDGNFIVRHPTGDILLPFTQDLYELTVPKITKGVYNVGDKWCIYVKTLPTRQYKRGLNPESCHCTPLHKAVYGLSTPNEFYSFAQTILEIDHDARSLDGVVRELVGHAGRPPAAFRAITTDFALSHSAEGESDVNGFDLWYHTCYVGKVFPDNKTIKIKNPVFLQEVLDTQKSWCFNYMVS